MLSHNSFLDYILLTNQFLLHSQWESKNVRIEEVAASAPFTLDRIRPSRLEFLSTLTLLIFDNSWPVSAIKGNKMMSKENSLTKSVNINYLLNVSIKRNIYFFTDHKCYSPSSLKSSTRIISWMSSSGLRFNTLENQKKRQICKLMISNFWKETFELENINWQKVKLSYL